MLTNLSTQNLDQTVIQKHFFDFFTVKLFLTIMMIGFLMPISIVIQNSRTVAFQCQYFIPKI